MAPSNIAHPERAYNNFYKKNRFIQGTKYTTEKLVKGKRTMHTIVPNVMVQNVGHKPNYRVSSEQSYIWSTSRKGRLHTQSTRETDICETVSTEVCATWQRQEAKTQRVRSETV